MEVVMAIGFFIVGVCIGIFAAGLLADSKHRQDCLECKYIRLYEDKVDRSMDEILRKIEGIKKKVGI